ncbi:MAG TPA: sigma-70 family RNA polymerase sigma factor [Planctomycetota bacterium]|nr:sigma-70 family RNA polymerase sigma factor [Planctomycetota bacterium]
MTDPHDPDQQLLDRWRAGDERARDALLEAVLPWLREEMGHVLGTQNRGSQESMDLAQAAVTNFLLRGPRFVPETPRQFRGLLKRIAKNELIDHWRRRKRAGGRHLESLLGSGNPLSGFAGPDPTGHAPPQRAADAEQREWVQLALQFLPEEDRWLLLASEVEGLDWPAIAAELGMPTPDAARMRGKRLKPRLANLMCRLQRGQLPLDD